MLIFRFIILIRITARVGLHVSVLIIHHFYNTLSPPVGQLTQNLNQHYRQLCFINSYFQNLPLSIHYVDIVWYHKVMDLKVWLLRRRFRSSGFCGREEHLLVQMFTFLTLKTFYMQKNIKCWGKGKKKPYLIPFRMMSISTRVQPCCCNK